MKSRNCGVVEVPGSSGAENETGATGGRLMQFVTLISGPYGAQLILKRACQKQPGSYDYVPRAHDSFWSGAMLVSGWSRRPA